MHKARSKEMKMKADVYDEGEVPHVYPNNKLRKPPSRKTRAWAKWLLLPAGLILLSVIPLIGGAFRLSELAGGAEITPANARFFASPLPVVLHIVGAGLYAVLGAFQFVSRLWQRGIRWHRLAGRFVVPCGLIVGLSALWMTLFYPWPEGDGLLLYWFRLLFGSGMVLSIVLGYVAIRRGNVIQHRAWMTRGYAIGLGAGTQPLALMVGEMVAGPPTELGRALLMGAGWVINLAIAEWALRRRRKPRARAALASVSQRQ
jgi:hypothetical protein